MRESLLLQLRYADLTRKAPFQNEGRKPVDHGPGRHSNPPPLFGRLAREGLAYLFNQLAERLVLLLARFGIAIERTASARNMT
jgi:hypothetical protein